MSGRKKGPPAVIVVITGSPGVNAGWPAELAPPPRSARRAPPASCAGAVPTLIRRGPAPFNTIEQLTRWRDTRRQEAVKGVLSRLRGKLSDADCAATEKAFSRFQNQFLHAPIRALTEETHAGAASGYTLVAAMLKLFCLPN
jgi:hypothetical protein